MKKVLLLLLIVLMSTISSAQFKLDSAMVVKNVYNPTLSEMEYAYFQFWEATAVKDTIILLRPKQFFYLQILDSTYSVRYDSVTGSGNNRLTWYTVFVNNILRTKFRLPYTITHNPFVSFDNEPLFVWTKVPESNVWYQLQTSTDSLFNTLVINDSALVDTSTNSNGRLKNYSTYWCRVRAISTSGNSLWSGVHKFYTYGGMRLKIKDRYLIIEPILITNASNPVNRQVQIRIRYHKIPQMQFYYLKATIIQ